MSDQSTTDTELQEFRRLRQGSYADVLFVLVPFLAVAMQLLWQGDINRLLLGPEISMAAAITAGLCISKFIQGLTLDPRVGVYKERLVFVIACTFFIILIPAVILTMKLSSDEEAPEIISFVQPVLLIIAISIYISAIRVIRAKEDMLDSRMDDEEDGTGAHESAFPVHVLDKPDSPASTPGGRN